MMKSIEGEEGDSGANEVAEEHTEPSPAQMEQHLSFGQNSQQDAMNEQSCNQEQITAPTTQPSATSSIPDVTNVDAEKFFRLVAASQSRRMDDQRVSASLLPGMEIFSSKGSALMNKWESDQLCNFVIRSQSSRMEDQRCAPPQIILTPDSPVTLRKSSSRPSLTPDPDTLSRLPPRSASFSPISDKERIQADHNTPIQTLSPAEQERLFSLVYQAMRGRMEDQRCYLDPSMRTPPRQTIPNIPEGLDPDHFFKLVAKVQSHRLDDQRVALGFLPGIQTPSCDNQSPLTAEETERFCNILSKVQSNRMDEQRCYAPNIQLGTPAAPRKVWPEPDSHNEEPGRPQSSSKSPRRLSTASNPPSETRWHQNNSSHTAQVPLPTNKEQYLSMVHQAQRWMEEQQNAFNPKALSTEQFFSLVANSQSKRMDDQRTAMPPVQTEKPSIPQIILTPGSPADHRAASSRRASLTQDPDSRTRPTPRSASFSPVSDKERMQYDNSVCTKLTFQVSVCLASPREGSKTDSKQGSHPDVFLTIGPPGAEGFVLPLTPAVYGPTTLEATPRSRRHHSRSSSPHRAHTRTAHPRSSSPKPSPHSCPISADEDYFSLIKKVHTTQLQLGNASEKNRETGKGKGKADGRKEKKDRAKRK